MRCRHYKSCTLARAISGVPVGAISFDSAVCRDVRGEDAPCLLLPPELEGQELAGLLLVGTIELQEDGTWIATDLQIETLPELPPSP